MYIQHFYAHFRGATSIFYNMLDTNNFSSTAPRAFYLSGTGTTLKDFSVVVENYPDSGDYAAAIYGWSCTNCVVDNVAITLNNTGKASGILFLYGTYVYQNTIRNVLVDGGVCGVFDRFWDLGTGSTHSHDTVIQNCIFQNCEKGALYKQTGLIGGNPVTNDVTLDTIIMFNTPDLAVVSDAAGCVSIINSNAVYDVDPMLTTYNDFPSCSKYSGTAGWKGCPFSATAPTKTVA